jgi:hypothetical protein
MNPPHIVPASALLSLLITCLPARAQTGRGPEVRFAIGGTVAREQSNVSGFSTQRTGVLIDGQGTFGMGPLRLGLAYREGNLGADNPVNDRTLVEGKVQLGLRLARWMLVEAGPLIRAYVTPGGTERWRLWEARARFEAQIAGPTVTTHVGVARVLGANLTGYGHGQSGDAGLTLRLGRSPWWAQLGYWVNQSSLSDGLRVETLQGILFALGLSLR